MSNSFRNFSMVCVPAEYTPRDPSMWGSQPDPGPGPYYGSGPERGPGSLGQRFTAPPPPLLPNTSRELISVPVNNGNHIVVWIVIEVSHLTCKALDIQR